MDLRNDQLKKKYFANFKVSQYRNPRFPNTIVISFIASVGAGKSYLANALGKELSIPIFSNDGIRRFLNEQGVDGDNPLPDLVIDIARARRDLLLENGISYILDADLTLTHKQDDRWTSERDAKLMLVRMNCPPELALIQIRQRADHGHSESKADEDRYLLREEERSKIPIRSDEIFFDFDVASSFESELSRLVAKLLELQG